MEQEPSVAVIVLNWNGFEDTRECLESLRRLRYGNYRIVLVDNGSDSDEGARLKGLFPEAHLIQNAVNRGFAGGNNDGIRWALQQGFDYIVNLNNDCIAQPQWLASLIAGTRSAGADFASSLITYYPETDLICSAENLLLPDGTGFDPRHFGPACAEKCQRVIFSASGAASLYSSACLRRVELRGGQFFDELYFAYLEDLDLGIRLHAAGFSGVSVPAALVHHKETRTSGYRSRFHIFHLEKNRVLNELLNYPAWLIPAGELFYCAKTLLRLTGKLAGKKRARLRNAGGPRGYRPVAVLLESRMWILKNISAILRDRSDRRARGLISGRIYKHFTWKIPL